MSQRVFAILMGLALVAPGVRAQEPASPVDPGQLASPLYAASVDGSVSLLRNGAQERLAENTPLLPGDRVRADAGRAELRSDRGQGIFLDESSVIDVASERSLRLVAGAVRVVVGGAIGSMSDVLRIDAPNATARALGPGDFVLRVSAGVRADETELRVFDGSAELATDRNAVVVGAGEVSVVRGGGVPSTPVAFEVSRDPFDQWVDDRLGLTQPTASASYLPADLASYSAVLDQNGTWQSEPEYGYVWYPSVPATWQPYTYGSWGYAGYYGWVWVGQGPWAWPTHHYGRWGWHHNRWFWIPGGAWAPAWVSWGVGPGYVGWCPLGWNNQPVFSLWAGNFGYDYYGGTRYHRYGAPHPGYGWTVLPSHHFRPGVAVSPHAVDYRRLDSNQRGAFVMQRTPPAYRANAAAGVAQRWQAPQVHSAVPRTAGVGPPSVAPRTGTGTGNAGMPSADATLRYGVSRGSRVSPPTVSTPGTRVDDGHLAPQPSARWPGQSPGRAGAGLAVPRTTDPGASAAPQYPPRYIGPGPGRRAPGSAPTLPQYGTPGAGVRSPGYTPPETHYGIPRAGEPSPQSAPAPPSRYTGAPARSPAGSAPVSTAPDTGRAAPTRPTGSVGMTAPPAGAPAGARSAPAAGTGGHMAVPRSGPPPRP